MDNNEKETSFNPTFIHSERMSVDNAKTTYHGTNIDLSILLAIIIKDLVSGGLEKHLVYRAVNVGLKAAKKEKRGKK